MAYAHDFIRSLPHKYETELGELGTGLSTGQKQRLAIARALLRNPSILIMDEATSHIDTESEGKIRASLKHIRQGRTVFVTTHRIENTIDADIVLVIVDGQVADSGSHQTLIKRCAVYRELIRPDNPTDVNIPNK